MTNLNLRNALFTALAVVTAYAPMSSAIVNEQSVTKAFATGTPAVTVKFSDLDIVRGTGAETLYRRLQTAAKSVCGNKELRDLSGMTAWRACYTQALNRAVEQINNERLTELHRG